MRYEKAGGYCVGEEVIGSPGTDVPTCPGAGTVGTGVPVEVVLGGVIDVVASSAGSPQTPLRTAPKKIKLVE